MSDNRSNCCHAPVRIGGVPDFPGDRPGDHGQTQYHVCESCGEPCGLADERILSKKQRDLPYIGFKLPLPGLKAMRRHADAMDDALAAKDAEIARLRAEHDAQMGAHRGVIHAKDQRIAELETTLDRWRGIINDDGSLRTDQEHEDILRDAMGALDKVERIAELEAAVERLRESFFGVDWHGCCSGCGSQIAATGAIGDDKHDPDTCPTCERGNKGEYTER